MALTPAQLQVIIDGVDKTQRVIQATTRSVGRLRNVIQAANTDIIKNQQQTNALLLLLVNAGINARTQAQNRAKAAQQVREARERERQKREHQKFLDDQLRAEQQYIQKQRAMWAANARRNFAAIPETAGAARSIGAGGIPGLIGGMFSGGIGGTVGALGGALGSGIGALTGWVPVLGEVGKGLGSIVSAAGALAGAITTTLVDALNLGAMTLAGFAGTLLAVGTGLVYAGIKLNHIREDILITLEAMTKSEAKARELFQVFSLYADLTPFEEIETVEAGKQLMAFGLTADRVGARLAKFGIDARLLLVTVGDAAHAMQLPLEQVVRLLGAASAGLFRIQQYAPAGINRKQLQRQGVIFNQTGGVENREMLLPATLKVFEERFGGTMEKASKTYEAFITTLQSHWRRFIRETMGPFFESWKTTLQEINKTFARILGLPENNSIKSALLNPEQIQLSEQGQKIVNALAAPFTMLGRALEFFGKNSQKFVDWLAKIADAEKLEIFLVRIVALLKTIGEGILKFFGIDLQKVFDPKNMENFFQTLWEWLVKVVEFAFKLGRTFVEVWDIITDKVSDLKDVFADFFTLVEIRSKRAFQTMSADILRSVAAAMFVLSKSPFADTRMGKMLGIDNPQNAASLVVAAGEMDRRTKEAYDESMTERNKGIAERESKKQAEFNRTHPTPIPYLPVKRGDIAGRIRGAWEGIFEGSNEGFKGFMKDLRRNLKQVESVIGPRSVIAPMHFGMTGTTLDKNKWQPFIDYQMKHSAFGMGNWATEMRQGFHAPELGPTFNRMFGAFGTPFLHSKDRESASQKEEWRMFFQSMTGQRIDRQATAQEMMRYNPGMSGLLGPLKGSQAYETELLNAFRSSTEDLQNWAEMLAETDKLGLTSFQDLFNAQSEVTSAYLREAQALQNSSEAEEITTAQKIEAWGKYFKQLDEMRSTMKRQQDAALNYLKTRTGNITAFFELFPKGAGTDRMKQAMVPDLLKQQADILRKGILGERDPQARQDMIRQLIGVGSEYKELFDTKNPFGGRFSRKGASAVDFILGNGPEADAIRGMIMNGSPGEDRILTPLQQTAQNTARIAQLMEAAAGMRIPGLPAGLNEVVSGAPNRLWGGRAPLADWEMNPANAGWSANFRGQAPVVQYINIPLQGIQSMSPEEFAARLDAELRRRAGMSRGSTR